MVLDVSTVHSLGFTIVSFKFTMVFKELWHAIMNNVILICKERAEDLGRLESWAKVPKNRGGQKEDKDKDEG